MRTESNAKFLFYFKKTQKIHNSSFLLNLLSPLILVCALLLGPVNVYI